MTDRWVELVVSRMLTIPTAPQTPSRPSDLLPKEGGFIGEWVAEGYAMSKGA